MKKGLFLLFLISLSVILFWGCSQFADSIPATTTKVISNEDVRALFPGHFVYCGDASYAEVNPAFAEKWHSYMGKVMDLLGMATNWSNQFDCNRFANVKLAVIHVRFLVDTWHKRNPGQGPAAAEFWYLVGGQAGQGHAIIATIENGQVAFRDIYSSKVLNLTQEEKDSAFLIKF
jgi:hypothetical protein